MQIIVFKNALIPYHYKVFTLFTHKIEKMLIRAWNKVTRYRPLLRILPVNNYLNCTRYWNNNTDKSIIFLINETYNTKN